MRRLLPDPAETISVEEAYAAPLGRHDDGRTPWVTLSMVASIDGSTVIDGRSGQLSSRTDGAVLAQLRSVADVIVVGAGTVRQEGYGRPRKDGQRIGVVTSTGDVDLDSDLFGSGAGFLIVPEDAEIGHDVDAVRAGTGRVDLASAIRRLSGLVGACAVVQAEGGAALNAALVDADVLDELNITTSPATVGGEGRRLTAGAGDHLHRFDLTQLAIDDESFLYGRWLRRR